MHIYIYMYVLYSGICLYSVLYVMYVMYVYLCIVVFTTEGILKVPIKNLPEWNSNPGTLNSVQTL